MEQELRGLLLAGLDGDASAYRVFLQRLSTLLRGYFRRRLQRLPDEVEDLVQDTLMAVHTQRHTYRPSEPLTAWVHALARYKLVDLWRRRGRRDNLNDSLDDLTEDQHPLAQEELPSRRDLAVLLEQLPESQRQAILLTKIEGLSMVEASNRSGVSVAALKVQVHRGLKQLAALVREES